jgi:hypothetical protein
MVSSRWYWTLVVSALAIGAASMTSEADTKPEQAGENPTIAEFTTAYNCD